MLKLIYNKKSHFNQKTFDFMEPQFSFANGMLSNNSNIPYPADMLDYNWSVLLDDKALIQQVNLCQAAAVISDNGAAHLPVIGDFRCGDYVSVGFGGICYGKFDANGGANSLVITSDYGHARVGEDFFFESNVVSKTHQSKFRSIAIAGACGVAEAGKRGLAIAGDRGVVRITAGGSFYGGRSGICFIHEKMIPIDDKTTKSHTFYYENNGSIIEHEINKSPQIIGDYFYKINSEFKEKIGRIAIDVPWLPS